MSKILWKTIEAFKNFKAGKLLYYSVEYKSRNTQQIKYTKPKQSQENAFIYNKEITKHQTTDKATKTKPRKLNLKRQHTRPYVAPRLNTYQRIPSLCSRRLLMTIPKLGLCTIVSEDCLSCSSDCHYRQFDVQEMTSLLYHLHLSGCWRCPNDGSQELETSSERKTKMVNIAWIRESVRISYLTKCIEVPCHFVIEHCEELCTEGNICLRESRKDGFEWKMLNLHY